MDKFGSKSHTLLWLSTRARPDLPCATSLAPQALFKNVKKLKDRLTHLLQYLKPTKRLGLLHRFPKKASNHFSLADLIVYSDSSFALASKNSETGIAVYLTYGTVRHMIHWQSCKESKKAESSAEAELYALTAAYKVVKNVWFLVQKALSDDILLNLRCDNQPTIAMLDNPSWRTKHSNIYGETIRQDIKKKSTILTYVNTKNQLPHNVRTPYLTTVHDRFYLLQGLIPRSGSIRVKKRGRRMP